MSAELMLLSIPFTLFFWALMALIFHREPSWPSYEELELMPNANHGPLGGAECDRTGTQPEEPHS